MTDKLTQGVSLRVNALASQVFTVSHSFQVGWLNAGSDTAQMVDFQADRDRSKRSFVGDLVNASFTAIDRDSPVPAGHGIAGKDQTTGGFLNTPRQHSLQWSACGIASSPDLPGVLLVQRTDRSPLQCRDGTPARIRTNTHGPKGISW